MLELAAGVACSTTALLTGRSPGGRRQDPHQELWVLFVAALAGAVQNAVQVVTTDLAAALKLRT